eukprot:scaffold54658_cov55-Phaeocystis_antarctica.AAC.2
MSVHAAPPPDSYCTGRLGSLVRHQAAITWVRGSALLWACCTHPMLPRSTMLYHAACHVRPEARDALDAGQAPKRPRIGTMGGRNAQPLILCDLGECLVRRTVATLISERPHNHACPVLVASHHPALGLESGSGSGLGI